MSLARTAARAMLAGIFVASGAQGVAKPDPHVPTAKRITDRVSPMVRRIHPALPSDARALVQLDLLVKLVAGLALVTPLRRPAAVALLTTLIPTTLAAHRFWEVEDPGDRRNQAAHLMKNLGLMGGLILAALDTEGRPGMRWRTAHLASDANRSLRRGARDTRTRFQLAARHNSIGRRLVS
ncbi:DoxX family protein [Rugosimonospora acidiphila]|uniref:DoxX family protein n=1 Tax=Rugosimonospora acidiphila TaxID=556531 RepID=A0ABP9RZL8_9ACTN